jgi:hypothetical protein
MEKEEPAASPSTQDFDGASDCSNFSIITPPSPPSVSSCSKCSSHDNAHENDSNVTPVKSEQELTRDEKRVPVKSTESGLETPEPCIHSLTKQSEYLRSKLTEVEAALERFKRPAAGKSANADTSTTENGPRTMTPERQADDQKQTVASLRDECWQLWENVNGVIREHWLEDHWNHWRSIDADGTPREDFPPMLTPSELADRKWCGELLKSVSSIVAPDPTLPSTVSAPALATDGITGLPPGDGKKKKKKGESKLKAPSGMDFPADLDQFGMPLAEQPPPMPPVEPSPEPYMDPFEMFFKTQQPKKWYDITEIDVRWWMRTALLVGQILRIIGVVILVFKAPGLLMELLDVMHPRNRDRCIGFRVRR